MKHFITFFLTVLTLLSFAQTPTTLPLQGALEDNGVPVDGTFAMDFSISLVGWSETQNVTVVNGIYSVVLGAVTDLPSDLFSSTNVHSLDITFDGNPLTSVNVYSPMTSSSEYFTDNNLRMEITDVNDPDVGDYVELTDRFLRFRNINDAVSSIFLTGKLGEPRLQISAHDDMNSLISTTFLGSTSTEGGYLSMQDFNGQQTISLLGDSAHADFSVPGKGAVSFGAVDPASNPADGGTLPYFFMFGDDGGDAPFDIRVADDGSGDYSRVIMNGPNGNNIFLSGFDGSGYFSGDLTVDGNINANINPNFSNLNVSDNGASFSVNIVNDPNNNDPSGYTAEMFLFGDESPTIQMGGQPWENGDLANLGLFGTNADGPGGGWYFAGLVANVNRDNGTGDEWGSISISKSDASDNQYQTIGLDGQNGRINFDGNGFNNASIGTASIQPDEEHGNIRLAKNDNNGENETFVVNANGDLTDGGAELIMRGADFSDKIRLDANGNKGSIDLTGPNGANNVSLFSNWGGFGQGALVIRDGDSNDRGYFTVNDYEDNGTVYHGMIDLNNNRNGAGVRLDGNGIISVQQESNNGNNSVEMFDGGGAGNININDLSNNNAISLNGDGGNGYFNGEVVGNFLKTRGANGVDKVNINANYDGGNDFYWGALSLNSPQDLDNVFLDYKTWETNPDLPYFRMNGTDDFGVGRPDLVWMNVEQWDDGMGTATEQVGSINFRSTTGAEFGINAYGFTGAINDFNVNNSLGVGNYDQGVISDNQSVNFHRGGDGSGNGALVVSMNSFDDGTTGNNWGSLQLYTGNSSGTTETIALNGENGDIAAQGNLATRSAEFGDAFDNGIVFMEANPTNGAARIDIYSGGDGSDNGAQTISLDGGSASISLGSSPEQDGFVINNGAPTLSVYSSGSERITLDGDNGQVRADGVTLTSDVRYKKNIKPIDNSLANISALRGVSYQWKDETKDQRTQIGVLAQEVEKVYPEFVHTDKHGMKSVNYTQMSAVLIEAIKELHAKVESLEKENSTLKAQASEIEALRTQMNQLWSLIGEKPAEVNSVPTED